MLQLRMGEPQSYRHYILQKLTSTKEIGAFVLCHQATVSFAFILADVFHFTRDSRSDFQTPLWAAVDKGHASAVAVLVDLGADVGSFNRFRNSSIFVLFALFSVF
jgi:hypothetical protein